MAQQAQRTHKMRACQGLTMNLCFGPEGTPGGALTATSHSSSYSMSTGSASATKGMSFLPRRMRVCTLQHRLGKL